MKDEIANITILLLQKIGTDISKYDDDFLKKSIQKRMSATGHYSLGYYLDYLNFNGLEAEELAGSLNITFSEFFRNPLTFACLEQIVLPALIEKKIKENENEIRIWSSACASGQEAYSIAILIDELLEIRKSNIACHIFATDINQSELEFAKKGIYPALSLNKVSMNRLRTYFTPSEKGIKEESYTVAPNLRHYLDFSEFDLASEQGFCPQSSIYGNFDLTFCSNLLFYYKPEYRKRILDKIGNCLSAGAYLVTGEAERDIVKGNNYREVFVSSSIFMKK